MKRLTQVSQKIERKRETKERGFKRDSLTRRCSGHLTAGANLRSAQNSAGCQMPLSLVVTGARRRNRIVILPMRQSLPQISVSFWSEVPAYSKRTDSLAAYNQKTSPLKRRTSFLSSLARTYVREPNHRAPLTSTGSSALAGPDTKTAARFRRRCGKRYVPNRSAL